MKAKQKRNQEEQKKEIQKVDSKAREKIELGIRKAKSVKEDMEKLCLQLKKSFGAKAVEQKKSAYFLAVEAVSLKTKRHEKLKEIEKLVDRLKTWENVKNAHRLTNVFLYGSITKIT